MAFALQRFQPTENLLLSRLAFREGSVWREGEAWSRTTNSQRKRNRFPAGVHKESQTHAEPSLQSYSRILIQESFEKTESVRGQTRQPFCPFAGSRPAPWPSRTDERIVRRYEESPPVVSPS